MTKKAIILQHKFLQISDRSPISIASWHVPMHIAKLRHISQEFFTCKNDFTLINFFCFHDRKMDQYNVMTRCKTSTTKKLRISKNPFVSIQITNYWHFVTRIHLNFTIVKEIKSPFTHTPGTVVLSRARGPFERLPGKVKSKLANYCHYVEHFSSTTKLYKCQHLFSC